MELKTDKDAANFFANFLSKIDPVFLTVFTGPLWVAPDIGTKLIVELNNCQQLKTPKFGGPGQQEWYHKDHPSEVLTLSDEGCSGLFFTWNGKIPELLENVQHEDAEIPEGVKDPKYKNKINPKKINPVSVFTDIIARHSNSAVTQLCEMGWTYFFDAEYEQNLRQYIDAAVADGKIRLYRQMFNDYNEVVRSCYSVASVYEDQLVFEKREGGYRAFWGIDFNYREFLDAEAAISEVVQTKEVVATDSTTLKTGLELKVTTREIRSSTITEFVECDKYMLSFNELPLLQAFFSSDAHFGTNTHLSEDAYEGTFIKVSSSTAIMLRNNAYGLPEADVGKRFWFDKTVRVTPLNSDIAVSRPNEVVGEVKRERKVRKLREM